MSKGNSPSLVMEVQETKDLKTSRKRSVQPNWLKGVLQGHLSGVPVPTLTK